MGKEVKLTKAQVRALDYISTQPVHGPAPGWNADCELVPDGQDAMDGVDLQVLFNFGLLTASPIPPPHSEDFDEESGSIVRDHEWTITPAGCAALEANRAKGAFDQYQDAIRQLGESHETAVRAAQEGK